LSRLIQCANIKYKYHNSDKNDPNVKDNQNICSAIHKPLNTLNLDLKISIKVRMYGLFLVQLPKSFEVQTQQSIQIKKHKTKPI